MSRAGFVLPPSDYYLRPLMVAEHQAGRNRHRFGGANDCLGGGLTPTRVLLRYIRSFVREVGGVTPFFLLSWFTSMAHDDFNGLKVILIVVGKIIMSIRDFATVMKNQYHTFLLYLSSTYVTLLVAASCMQISQVCVTCGQVGGWYEFI